MLLDSKPARFFLTRLARAHGFLDPVGLVAKLRRFSQPSEVAEPIELMRAGALFHARGLINTRAIQHNLDWVWPYWVERQFNPSDESFIPRAFSFSHINLTHRNWTAVGLPDVPWYPIVDPRGLVTPLFDGWSIDFWFLPMDDGLCVPSKLGEFRQKLLMGDNLSVRSVATWATASITSDLSLVLDDDVPTCRVLVGAPEGDGHVAVALRPYNPEGISFVHKVAVSAGRRGWAIEERDAVKFDREPARHVLSTYKSGDVSHHLRNEGGPGEASCDVGLAGAAALFRCSDLREMPLEIRMPIRDELRPGGILRCAGIPSWGEALASFAKLEVGDARTRDLYDASVATMLLLTPDEVYPGPFTYKRFWFRDAALILNPLLAIGGVERTRRALAGFEPRQRGDGYFLSQEGEWDSNGEAIWIYHQFARLTGEELPRDWLNAVRKGAQWIMSRRLPESAKSPGAGLFPAGFSAEHLGPNDFYYWDNFWGVEGLRSAASLLAVSEPDFAAMCRAEADAFMAVIERSIPRGPGRRFPGAIPAAPTRRMDSGAIGSLVADYPLQLFAPGDERMILTADYLRESSSHDGGFFQHMIHSGINAYLTLHLAQVRLRAGDRKEAWRLMDAVANLASPTGQWPEAIHPRTHGGCMGDGQHAWASAEWVMMVKNCFVREEAGELVIAAGVRPEWWSNAPASLGAVLTSFGPLTVRIATTTDGAVVSVDGTWRGKPPRLQVRLPGFEPQAHEPDGACSRIELKGVA